MVMIDYYEVARVSQTRVGRFQMYGRPKLSKSVQKRITKVVMEYSLTELDERDKPNSAILFLNSDVSIFLFLLAYLFSKFKYFL